MKYASLSFETKGIDEANHSLRAVFSTGGIDRHGEIVDQKSWQLDDFIKNPVVLFSHDHNQPPIGMVTGLGYNGDGNLEGTVKFAAKEYPFANVIWNLYKGGFMRAFSVGFASSTQDVIDGTVILRDNTLFELSSVAVPANAMALAKSKGIDTAPLEIKMAETVTVKDEQDENAEDVVIDNAEVVEEVSEAVVEDVEEKAKAQVGDSCEMPNGDKGTMQMDGDTMVCMPMKQESAKGAIAEEVDAEAVWEEKYANMDEVSEIMGAFWTVYMDEATDVKSFPTLLSEVASLLQTVADEYDPNAAPVDDEAKGVLKVALEGAVNADSAKAYISALMKKYSPGTVTETVKEAVAVIEKAGKVLSKANRTAIENAVSALKAVLEADSPAADGEEEKELEVVSTNSTALSIKVETPAVRIVVPAKGQNKAKLINKAIRALLAEKAKH